MQDNFFILHSRKKKYNNYIDEALLINQINDYRKSMLQIFFDLFKDEFTFIISL